MPKILRKPPEPPRKKVTITKSRSNTNAAIVLNSLPEYMRPKTPKAI